MATLSVQTKSGVAKSLSLANANSGGDVVPNDDGGVVIMVQNGDASSKTVTVKSYFPNAIPEGLAKSDLAVVVAAGEVAKIGPLSAAPWNNASKQVELTYSAVTSVKVAAYKGT
jgi:predicted transcriptional regulator